MTGAGWQATAPQASNDNGFSTAFGAPLIIAAASLLADGEGDPLRITGKRRGERDGVAGW